MRTPKSSQLVLYACDYSSILVQTELRFRHNDVFVTIKRLNLCTDGVTTAFCIVKFKLYSVQKYNRIVEILKLGVPLPKSLKCGLNHGVVLPFGKWRSLVTHLVTIQGYVSSSLTFSIFIIKNETYNRLFFQQKSVFIKQARTLATLVVR